MQPNNDILLIFPPVWITNLPFLSNPTLLAYLKKEGINAEQMDINVDYWKYLYSNNFIADVHNKLILELNRYKQSNSIKKSDLTTIKKIAIFVEMPEEQFVQEVQEKIIPQNIYIELIGLVSRFKLPLKSVDDRNYHDILFSSISLSHLAASTKKILRIVRSKNNPFNDFFNSIIGDIINKSAKIIGISITAVNQVIPAFTLAYRIKKVKPECKIVIGGSWCSLVNEDLGYGLNEFPFIDYVIVNEGEIPLLDLIKAEKSEKTIEEIKGVYYKKDGQVFYSKNDIHVNLSQMPAPDFTGLDIDYYSEKQTLSIQSSRGCYWGKCIYCSYPLLESKYKTKTIDQLIQEIKCLQLNYNTKSFIFVDTVVSPSFAKKFSEAIILNNIQIEWIIFARLETQFSSGLLSLMKKSGCSEICWGLESANKRILQVINKNIDLIKSETILRDAAKAGIHNRVFLMYGLPTEKFNEAMDTVNFLEKNISNIHSISYNQYSPEKNTPIETFCKINNMNLKRKIGDNFSFSYLWGDIFNKKWIKYIANEFDRLDNHINYIQNSSAIDNVLSKIYLKESGIKFEFIFKGHSISLISHLINGGNSFERIIYEIK